MSFSSIEQWIVIGVIAVGTFALRLSFVAWLGGREAPSWLTRTLRFIPPTVLAALTAPAVLGAGVSGTEDGGRLAYVLAACLALGVAWRTRSLLLPIGTGMAAMWALRAML